MDGIDDLTYEQNVLKANKARKAAYELQQAKLRALQDALSNYGNFRYVDLEDFIDPNNQNWKEYKYYAPDSSTYLMGPPTQGYVNSGTPVGMFIQRVRDAKNIDDVNKQFKLWNLYKPLDSSDNGTSYIRYFIPRFGMHSTTPSVGSRPVQTTAGGTGGAQGVVTVGGAQGAQAGNTDGGTQGVQGAQAGVKTGNAVAGGGVQGSNNGSGKKPRMSDAEINAFLNEELGGDTTGNGTYASAGVPRGGTKTIGYDPYDPNPGNVSLAYAMRNAPEQERRTALINKWNKEHGISYATGKDGLIYRTDPQHPNGYVDPFKNDLSKIGSTGYATGQGMLTSGSNGFYSSQEGMQSPMPVSDNWKFREAWKDPMAIIGHFGRGAFTDDEYNQLVNHAVNDLGFNKNIFSGL